MECARVRSNGDLPDRDEKRLRMRLFTQFSSAWSELFVRFIIFSVGSFGATLYGKVPALCYNWKG